MKEKLGILLFIYCLQIALSKAEATDHKGYCVVHYTELLPVTETYVHTYMRPELQLCYEKRIYRYYNCWKDVKRSETRTKTVPKSVARTRTECCAGYKNVTVHENIFQCEPICDPPCIKGHCTLPGNCTCFQGYEHQESNKCIPSCNPECINGLCTSPGHCECKEGYEKVNNSYCKPHCSRECFNGVCHKPEECLCNTGYKKNDNNFDCEPICDVPCINATCTSYNECTCWQGYGKITGQDNACMPICELECLNGDCTAPNTCTCYDGYSKNDSINICQAECADCQYGYCIKPNVCNCYENYTSNGNGGCEPICNNCTNGVCIAPYECECMEGYQLEEIGDQCIPYCDSCENGECIEPNVCRCFEGYENSTGICFPSCEYGCFGGECIAPNNCSCSRYDRVEENICFPLQQNGTNSSENITPKRFLINIKEVPNLYQIYDLHLSTINIKINCSHETFYNFGSGSEQNSSNSIDCLNTKNALDPYVLCLWNGFSSDIHDIYRNMSSFLHQLNETESEKHYIQLGMTILLPTEMMSEDEHCYLCPSWEHLRTTMPGSFRIPLKPCEFKELQNGLLGYDLKEIGFIGLALLVAVILIISGLVIFYKSYMKRDYYVRSSRLVDQIDLSLNHED